MKKKRAVKALSKRQQQILEAFWRGESITDTADRLHLNRKTIELYRRNTKHKFKVDTMAEAAHAALRLGWLTVKGV